MSSICGKHRIELKIDPYLSGKELLFELEDPQRQPDLIYLDIDMPGMDGSKRQTGCVRAGLRARLSFSLPAGRPASFYGRSTWMPFHYVVKDDTPWFEQIFLRAHENAERKTRETLIFSRAGESRKVFVRDIHYFRRRRATASTYITGT